MGAMTITVLVTVMVTVTIMVLVTVMVAVTITVLVTVMVTSVALQGEEFRPALDPDERNSPRQNILILIRSIELRHFMRRYKLWLFVAFADETGDQPLTDVDVVR